MKNWISARRTLLSAWLVSALVLSGCETPVNDTDLPPEATVPRSEPDATTSTPTPDATPTPTPDVTSQPLEDAHSEPPVDDTMIVDDTTEEAKDIVVSIPDVAGTECESEAACVLYWLAYSNCLVQYGGEEAAVDPSLYTEDCAVTCDLARMVDYPTYYTCMLAGIPEDCSAEGMEVPTDCSP